MANQKHMGAAGKAGIGAGIAASAAAAALGVYLLYGSKNAPKNRAKVKGWMLKAKGEVLSELENMGQVTEGAYQDVVNRVLASYRGARNVRSAELVELAADLRRHWRNLSEAFQEGQAPKRVKSKAGGPGKGTARRPRRRKTPA